MSMCGSSRECARIRKELSDKKWKITAQGFELIRLRAELAELRRRVRDVLPRFIDFGKCEKSIEDQFECNLCSAKHSEIHRVCQLYRDCADKEEAKP